MYYALKDCVTLVPGGVGVDAENGFFPRPDFCGSEQMSTLLNFFSSSLLSLWTKYAGVLDSQKFV